jgi:hypothetical protein
VRRSRLRLWDRVRRQRNLQHQEEQVVGKAVEVEPVAAQVAARQPRTFLRLQRL